MLAKRVSVSPERSGFLHGETKMENWLVHTVTGACAFAGTGKTVLIEAIRSGALSAVKRECRTVSLPANLRALFTRAFTAGLADPLAGRVRETEWDIDTGHFTCRLENVGDQYADLNDARNALGSAWREVT